MTLVVRFVLGACRDLATYVIRTGRWWLPLSLFALVVALVASAVGQAAVPTAVYTLF